jgi:SEC-C motif-containing protein
MNQRACPCQSGRPLAACCGPYLENQRPAPTAEALMRARYSAFVLKDEAYLIETWDPAHRPARLDLGRDRTEWLGLTVLSTELGGEADDEGRVEFAARFRVNGKEEVLRENSRFRRSTAGWIYVSGELGPPARPTPHTAAPGPARNAPCPCGSGQKWKRCCGK